jgi:hypothetical protein
MTKFSWPRYPLPWPDPLLPTYKRVSIGKWKCEPTPDGDRIMGYWRPHNYAPPGWMFLQKLKDNWLIWMSLTPMELESHMPHIAAAHGTVVVAGLGMGFYLYNILRKPEVTKVIVLEKDRNVGRLFAHSIQIPDWQGFHKADIVFGDALNYKPDFPVDFLYADIWPHLGDYQALNLTQKLQANIKAKEVGFWGQEFDFITWLMDRKLPGPVDSHATHANYNAFCAEVGLPLVERESKRYPKLAYVAVTLQTSINTSVPKDQGVILTAQALGVLQQDLAIDLAVNPVG